jgi:DNA adenine methylase
MPQKIDVYHEHFFGGGAVFFELFRAGRIKKAVLSDSNLELITTCRAIKNDVNGVIGALFCLGTEGITEDYYNDVRAARLVDETQIAARMIWLNKNNYGGLYRVNKKAGEFNVPWSGRETYTPDVANILAVSEAFQIAEFYHHTYFAMTALVENGHVVYYDPPYIPVSKTSKFTEYQREGFTHCDQLLLAKTYGELVKRGAHVFASNADVNLAREMYRPFCTQIIETKVSRAINSNGKGRGKVGELLFCHTTRKRESSAQKAAE